jgi:hypothetical protein
MVNENMNNIKWGSPTEDYQTQTGGILSPLSPPTNINDFTYEITGNNEN